MPNDYIIEPIKKVLNKKKPVMLEEQIRDEVPQELEEETNVRGIDYELIKNISPLIENFTGENDINENIRNRN